jgi:phosphoenolpyruvate carboxykinase (ATP)
MLTLDRPGGFPMEAQGRNGQERVFRNLSRGALVQKAIEKGECELTESGAIVVRTGKFTGRSPKDKFIVQYGLESEININWGCINQPISREKTDKIIDLMLRYSKTIPLFIQDIHICRQSTNSLSFQVISEYAWHSLFVTNLFQSTSGENNFSPDYLILDFPNIRVDPSQNGLNSQTFIIIDFEQKLIIIGGTGYAGEIKKAIFTIMNKILPESGILPMHCSANMGEDKTVAIFFGLSGTGKTTLSSDEHRSLIGDDEHGWDNDGVFNIENGCYAKTIGLKYELEPQIYSAVNRFGTVLENVILDPVTSIPNFDDRSLTENTRAAYPLQYIDGSIKEGRGNHPKDIFFLSADAFGVLPPISLLTNEQIDYYFLSGFTSKLAGTELGLSSEPAVTFSTCFAAPFLPLYPKIYAELLKKKLNNAKTRVWLINTGWCGGNYGKGSRIKLAYTRSMVRAAINDQIDLSSMIEDDNFHLHIPCKCPDVPEEILFPSKSWKNTFEYKEQCMKLMSLFEMNGNK